MSAPSLPARFLRRCAHHYAQGGLRHAIRQTSLESQLHVIQSWNSHLFDRFRRQRAERFGADLRGLRCPGEPGLVSIVLPVYNGAALVGQAIDSVLAQRYPKFELIALNDGSKDSSAAILDRYAERDPRIRVVHQENRKLPRTLSRGFRLARGEFLTWTSDDNLLRPECLEKLVGCLLRHPSWDMVYANEDLIDAHGQPLRGSPYFLPNQSPPGSEHIVFPESSARLNTVMYNYVGAAFMYRSRVAYLLGDYSAQRFTVEDYDYWLQVNTLLNLHHADFPEPIYDYRFHGESLTARIEELGGRSHLIRLMEFDTLRRERFKLPILWLLEDASSSGAHQALVEALRARAEAAEQHVRLLGDGLPLPQVSPSTPILYVRLASQGQASELPPPALRDGSVTLAALVLADGAAPVPAPVPAEWDVCAALGPGASDADSTPRLRPESYQGLWRADDISTVFSALEVRCRAEQARMLEAQLA